MYHGDQRRERHARISAWMVLMALMDREQIDGGHERTLWACLIVVGCENGLRCRLTGIVSL